MSRVVDVAVMMARKLQIDLVALGKLRAAGPPKTFPAFREVRSKYREILGLIFSIQSRIDEAGSDLPPNFAQWAVRQKLSALAIFTVSGRKASVKDVSMSPPWMP